MVTKTYAGLCRLSLRSPRIWQRRPATPALPGRLAMVSRSILHNVAFAQVTYQYQPIISQYTTANQSNPNVQPLPQETNHMQTCQGTLFIIQQDHQSYHLRSPGTITTFGNMQNKSRHFLLNTARVRHLLSLCHSPRSLLQSNHPFRR